MDAWTCSLTVPVATRMGRKGEENVLSNGFRQIDFLPTGELYLNGEIIDGNRQPEALQAADAGAVHLCAQPPGGKEAAIAQPYIQSVRDWQNWNDVRTGKVENDVRVLPLVSPSFRGDLIHMNFHSGPF